MFANSSNGRTAKANALLWQRVLLVAALVVTVAYIPIGNYGQMLGRWPFLLIGTGLGVVAAMAAKKAHSGSPASWVLGAQLVILGGYLSRLFLAWVDLFFFIMFFMPIIAAVLAGLTIRRLKQSGEPTSQPYSLAEAEKRSIYHEAGSQPTNDAASDWVQVGTDVASAPGVQTTSATAAQAKRTTARTKVTGSKAAALGSAVGTLNALFWLLVINLTLQIVEVIAALAANATVSRNFLMIAFILAIYSQIRSKRAGLTVSPSYLVYGAMAANLVPVLMPDSQVTLPILLFMVSLGLQLAAAIVARRTVNKAKKQLPKHDPKRVYRV